MCQGFGGFYHKSGAVYFTTPDDDGDCSHSKTAEVMPKGLDENDLVPFEIPEWKESEFHWDTIRVPEWAQETPCIKKLKEAKPHWKKYEKVTAPAWAEYEKVTAPAWAEYKTAPVWAEYEKVRVPAWAEFISSLKTIDGYCEEE